MGRGGFVTSGGGCSQYTRGFGLSFSLTRRETLHLRRKDQCLVYRVAARCLYPVEKCAWIDCSEGVRNDIGDKSGLKVFRHLYVRYENAVWTVGCVMVCVIGGNPTSSLIFLRDLLTNNYHSGTALCLTRGLACATPVKT